MKIKEVIPLLNEINNRYGLKFLHIDYTDTTLISRIGISLEIFIQVYVNIKKAKLNLALVVAGERIYGIDKEGGSYHEHPYQNPALHIDCNQTDIDTFVFKSIGILKEIKLI